MTGRHWAIACLDCLVGFELGRLVEIADDGWPVAPQFGGHRDLQSKTWVDGPALGRFVELFLIQHLGHEIGIVDSDAVTEALESYEIGEEPFVWVATGDALTGVYRTEDSGRATAKLLTLLKKQP